MAKFLTLWELDATKLPEKPEEQLALYIKQLNMIKEDFEKKKDAVSTKCRKLHILL